MKCICCNSSLILRDYYSYAMDTACKRYRCISCNNPSTIEIVNNKPFVIWYSVFFKPDFFLLGNLFLPQYNLEQMCGNTKFYKSKLILFNGNFIQPKLSNESFNNLFLKLKKLSNF